MTVSDDADPVPYWLISTRRPVALAAAVEAARAARLTPVTAARSRCCCVGSIRSWSRPPMRIPGDAGADLRSRESFVLEPGRAPTGVRPGSPSRYRRATPPSSIRVPGWPRDHGVSIVNTPGTIDAGYRGEVRVCLVNTDRQVAVPISRGDRIAQLVVQPVSRAVFVPVAQLPDSSRGSGRIRIDRLAV